MWHNVGLCSSNLRYTSHIFVYLLPTHGGYYFPIRDCWNLLVESSWWAHCVSWAKTTDNSHRCNDNTNTETLHQCLCTVLYICHAHLLQETMPVKKQNKTNTHKRLRAHTHAHLHIRTFSYTNIHRGGYSVNVALHWPASSNNVVYLWIIHLYISYVIGYRAATAVLAIIS